MSEKCRREGDQAMIKPLAKPAVKETKSILIEAEEKTDKEFD